MPAIEDLTRKALMSEITTPSTVESGIDALEFVDRYPTCEAAANLRREGPLL
jgi:hypothetical protein